MTKQPTMEQVFALAKGIVRFAWLPHKLKDGTWCWLTDYVRYYHAKRNEQGIWSLTDDVAYDDVLYKLADERHIRTFISLLPRYLWTAEIKCSPPLEASYVEAALGSIIGTLSGPLYLKRYWGRTGAFDISIDAEKNSLTVQILYGTTLVYDRQVELAETIASRLQAQGYNVEPIKYTVIQ